MRFVIFFGLLIVSNAISKDYVSNLPLNQQKVACIILGFSLIISIINDFMRGK